jgi:hypothetical protein
VRAQALPHTVREERDIKKDNYTSMLQHVAKAGRPRTRRNEKSASVGLLKGTKTDFVGVRRTRCAWVCAALFRVQCLRG